MTHTDTLGTVVSIDGTPIKGIDKDNIPVPDGDTDDKDVSTLDSGYFQEVGLGMFKPGSAKITGNKLSGDLGQGKLSDAFGDRRLHTITVDVKEAGEIYTYNAFVTKYNPSSDNNTYKFSSNLLASGPFSLDTTYADLTTVAAGGAGAVIYPSAITVDTKTVIIPFPNSTATTTLTFTAAAAAYIGISADDGTNWNELTSGVASAAVNLTAGGIVERLLKIEEAQKATRFVKIFLLRAPA